MSQPFLENQAVRLVAIAAGVVVVVAGLKAAESLFVPVLLALFLSVLTFPLLFWLQARGLPTVVAVGVTMLAVIAVLGALGLVLSASLAAVSEAVPRYQELLRETIGPLVAWFEGRGVRVGDWVMTKVLDPGNLLLTLSLTFKGVARAVSATVLVLLLMIFFLAEAVGFSTKLGAALRREQESVRRFSRITRQVQRYLLIKTAISAATGLCLGLWLWVVHLDFPLLWGFIAFLLHYIPNVGSVVAAIPPIFLATIQLGPTGTVLVALGYITVNTVIGNIIEPNLMGDQMSLSPAVVLLSLLFWGWVWGPVGMLLSVPLTMIVKVLAENTQGLGWLAVLLAPSPQK